MICADKNEMPQKADFLGGGYSLQTTGWNKTNKQYKKNYLPCKLVSSHVSLQLH